MDLPSARALMLVCKSNDAIHSEAIQVMLLCYTEEANAFARNSAFFPDAHEQPVPPVNRCVMRRGGGRCRGAASEVSITHMCAYHQVRHTGDLNLDEMRRFSVDHPGLYRLVFPARPAATGT